MFELPEADTVWSDEHEIRGDPAIVMPGRTRDIDVGARLTWYVFGLMREENESKGITGKVIDAHLHSPFQRSSSETSSADTVCSRGPARRFRPRACRRDHRLIVGRSGANGQGS